MFRLNNNPTSPAQYAVIEPLGVPATVSTRGDPRAVADPRWMDGSRTRCHHCCVVSWVLACVLVAVSVVVAVPAPLWVGVVIVVASIAIAYRRTPADDPSDASSRLARAMNLP